MLSQIHGLLKRADEIRDEERLKSKSGDEFNIFNVLNVEHYETITHTPFLAELLNPEGQHGQGAKFLQLFLQRFGLHLSNPDRAKVRQNLYIGVRTDEEGGLIDICITDQTGSKIIIENKIYAGLQEHQLKRYHNYDPKAQLLFLTLNGDPPVVAKDEIPDNLKCISYKKDITEWLQDCQSAVANIPNVCQIIAQYIRLVQELTNQNANKHMSEEIKNAVLQSEQSFLSYNAMIASRSTVRAAVIETFKQKLNKVVQELGLEFSKNITSGDMSKKWSYFALSNPSFKKLGLEMWFEFEGYDYGKFYFGINYTIEGAKCPMKAEIQKRFQARFGKAGTGTTPEDKWVVWHYWHEHFNWTDSNDKTFVAIQFGRFVEDEFKDVLQKLKDCISS